MADWVILGGQGMLGTELTNLLAKEECLSFSRNDCDITDPGELKEKISSAKYIINCAAYTAVDGAETNETKAFEINAIGAKNSAHIAKSLNAKYVYVSTDYVFSGDANTPYIEDDPTEPKTAYGRTKLAGEREINNLYPEKSFIVRTAWLYGQYGPNFVKTIIELEKERENLNVVVDQLGQPTWTLDLARKIIELLQRNAQPGVYHGTSSGEASWYEFAKEIFLHIGADPNRILPTDSTQFARPAPRPNYSVLGHSTWDGAGISPIQNWRDALSDAFAAGIFKDA